MDKVEQIDNMYEARLKRICVVLCQSGKFETGEGTCAAICMSELGDPRKKGCPHAATVHRELAVKIESVT